MNYRDKIKEGLLTGFSEAAGLLITALVAIFLMGAILLLARRIGAAL